MRLALGTAQFGFDYGIVNAGGRISQEDAKSILALARFGGIDTLDTAIAYGESEEMLGQLGVDDFSIVTKLPSIENATLSIKDWVESALESSCRRLRVGNVDALLLHHPEDLLGTRGKELAEALARMKEKQLCRKIGISVYSPSQLDIIWPLWRPDVVQCPFNILDRRIESSGWAAKLAANDIELHLRSIFLQGLLLTPSDVLPSRFNNWKPLFWAIECWANDNGLSRLEAALACATGLRFATKAVVGVDGSSQLRSILQAFRAEGIPVPIELSTEDERLINPTMWSK